MVPPKTVLPLIKDLYHCQACQKVAKNAKDCRFFFQACTSLSGCRAGEHRNQPSMTGISSCSRRKSRIVTTNFTTGRLR